MGGICSPSVALSGEATMINTRAREQAAVLALIDKTELRWYQMGLLIEEAGSALELARRNWTGLETFDVDDVETTTDPVSEDDIDRFEELIADTVQEGTRLVTVLDHDYPTNLRLAYDRPPFLFIRGEFTEGDERAIAVVGTRAASKEGLATARRLAKELVDRKVTVLSGLALGIDGAAHTAALDEGGRTVAVLGAGIDARIYPPAHEDLAQRIVDSGGALVSQFWPWAAPTRYSFPMRNRVTSGLGVGTVVVEASRTSGAAQQARIATEHGKRVFLVEHLVMQESWAQRLSAHPAVQVVKSIDEVVSALDEVQVITRQLSLS